MKDFNTCTVQRFTVLGTCGVELTTKQDYCTIAPCYLDNMLQCLR